MLIVVYLVVIAIIVAGMWKTFTKAGQPGWAAIVPIYNIVVLLEIAGRPVWWIVLFLIPCVNLIVSIIVMIDVAAKFGKSAGFGVGLALLGFIFFPILGFGDAQYQGTAARY
ncbi:MAG: signal peptidase I [Planctomycetota bacterium]|nr:MAG: signal peptidase I [Planctomycetota bacterium]